MVWAIVITIRLLVPLTIFRWNLWGSILSIIADNLDVIILDFLGVKDFTLYNQIDKYLDTYFYLIQGYTMLFWKNKDDNISQDTFRRLDRQGISFSPASFLLAFILCSCIINNIVRK